MTAPIVLEKHRATIAWLIPRLSEFPKDQRFLLADRIQRAMLDIQEIFVRAIYSKEKAALHDEINIQLDVVRMGLKGGAVARSGVSDQRSLMKSSTDIPESFKMAFSVQRSISL